MTDNASEACVRLSRRLKTLRQARGFKTARSFASKLDIHENRYTRYERAEVEPDLELLERFCSILQITPNDLLSETIDMASEPTTEPAMATAPSSGFTESQQSGFTAASGTASGTTSGDPSANRFAAEVMALSTLLAEISLQHHSKTPPPPAETIKLSSELYQQIMDNPFGVLPTIGTKIPIHAADLSQQAQVAAQLKTILAHFREASAS